MIEFEIVITPTSAGFSIGGVSEPRSGADKASAIARDGRPFIPASALRGALRIELERLLAGVSDGPPPDQDEPPRPEVARLFGDRRGRLGTLRIDDALVEGPAKVPSLTVRSRVAIDRKRGSAADRLLGFTETANLDMNEPVAFCAKGRLVPLGIADDEASLEKDLDLLQAAALALAAIGGDRARGSGWVECRINRVASVNNIMKAEARPVGGDFVLRFEALAQMRFGSGQALGQFQPTLDHAPASTVRGALCYALLEKGLASPGEVAALAEDGEISFGDARVPDSLASATTRRCRTCDHEFEELPVELIRRLAANQGVVLAPLTLSACRRCDSPKVVPVEWARSAGKLEFRTRTRTAIDRRYGSARTGQLFSQQVIEPHAEDGAVVFESTVRGISRPIAALLARLDNCDVNLGAGRSRGMGRCRMKIVAAAATRPDKVMSEIASFSGVIHSGWSSLRKSASGLSEAPVPVGSCLLAVKLTGPLKAPVGVDGGVTGPLDALGAGRALMSVVNIGDVGGFGANEADRWGADAETRMGEKTPVRVVLPGSVFVYQVSKQDLEMKIDEWVKLGGTGSGSNRSLGWGRFEFMSARAEESETR